MSEKFNYIKIPNQWKPYWDSYPEGHTLLEALIHWVSQVNKMVDNVNDWNEYLKEFVETFDENLRAEVVEQLNKWIEDGTLIEIIGADLLDFKLDTTVFEEFKTNIEGNINKIATFIVEDYIELEADVTRGIQRAIDEALMRNHGRILLSGIYDLSEPLVIDRLNTYNNTQIVIFGGGQLRKGPNFNGDRLIHIRIGFHDEDNIVFENISFDGVDRTINGLDSFGLHVPYNEDGEEPSDGDQTKFISFKNCTFHRFYRAFRLSSLSYNFISCLFQNNIYGGFLNASANNNTFVACSFRRNVVGVHVKQLSHVYGTMNNVFVNCIFESNNNAGFINESANFTALFGGYFENNCFAIDTNYIYPTPKSDIQFIGSGNTGVFVLHGVFFWRNATEYALSGVELNRGYIKASRNVTLHFDRIFNLESDLSPSDIIATSNNWTSTLNLNGVRYNIEKGVMYEVAKYQNNVIKEMKTIFKTSPVSPGTNSKVDFVNIEIHNTTLAKVTVKVFLNGRTDSGNVASEGFIERTFLIAKKTNAELNYTTTPIGDSVKGYATSISGAGDFNTGDCLTQNSEIVMEKTGDRTFIISIEEIINQSLPNWGHATTLAGRFIVEVEGTNLTGNFGRITTEIITLS